MEIINSKCSHNTYSVPGTDLTTFHILAHLIFAITLRYSYHPHFADEETAEIKCVARDYTDCEQWRWAWNPGVCLQNRALSHSPVIASYVPVMSVYCQGNSQDEGLFLFLINHVIPAGSSTTIPYGDSRSPCKAIRKVK